MTRQSDDQARPSRVRVAAYVIRHTSMGAQLLVFDHIGIPAAGTQVPAGGVAPGETLEDAVLREVAEETGLTSVVLVGAVGTEDRPHPPCCTAFTPSGSPDPEPRTDRPVRGRPLLYAAAPTWRLKAPLVSVGGPLSAC